MAKGICGICGKGGKLVFSPQAELFLPAQKAKAKKDRRVPISSALLAVLQAQ